MLPHIEKAMVTKLIIDLKVISGLNFFFWKLARGIHVHGLLVHISYALN